MHTGLRLDFKYLGHVSQLLQGGERAGGRAALPHQVGQVAMVAVAAVAVALGVAASPLLLGLKRTGKAVNGGRRAVCAVPRLPSVRSPLSQPACRPWSCCKTLQGSPRSVRRMTRRCCFAGRACSTTHAHVCTSKKNKKY